MERHNRGMARLYALMNVQFLTSYNFNFDIGIGDKVGAIRKTHSQTSDKTFIYREN